MRFRAIEQGKNNICTLLSRLLKHYGFENIATAGEFSYVFMNRRMTDINLIAMNERNNRRLKRYEKRTSLFVQNRALFAKQMPNTEEYEVVLQRGQIQVIIEEESHCDILKFIKKDGLLQLQHHLEMLDLRDCLESKLPTKEQRQGTRKI